MHSLSKIAMWIIKKKSLKKLSTFMKQEFNIKEVVLIKSFEYKLLIRLCQFVNYANQIWAKQYPFF